MDIDGSPCNTSSIRRAYADSSCRGERSLQRDGFEHQAIADSVHVDLKTDAVGLQLKFQDVRCDRLTIREGQVRHMPELDGDAAALTAERLS